MRHHADRRRARTVFREILSCCDGFILFDVEAIFLYPWAFIFRSIAVVRFRGNAPLHRDPAGGLFLSLEERGAGLEPPSRTPGPDFVTETPDLEQNPNIAKIRAWRPEAIAELISFRGELTVVVSREHLRPLAEFLISDADLAFTYLSDVTGVDRFPIEPRFELNYHLLSISRRDTIRLRVRLPGDSPVIESVVPVWPTANWHEREIFDLFGIRFEGHPNLAAHAVARRLGRLSPPQGLSSGGSSLISTSEPAP
jgi:NADH-quinone oxidoreductase subunit C